MGRRDGLSHGRGISIFEAGQLPLQAAQFDFIVGIIPGRAEYRIHVFAPPNEEPRIIATQQKIGILNNPSLIRNHDSGVIYSTQELRMSKGGIERAKDWSIKTVLACGLNFGAVDLLQSEDGLLYVLECNSAPGTSSLPIYSAYKEEFRKLLV